VKLANAVGGVAATFLLGLAGLFLPGPAGNLASFVWLGAFPGLAIARLLVPGAPAATRWTLGLALSPLVASIAGWALLASGQPLVTAARLVAMAGWLLYAGGEARTLASAAAETDAPADRRAWAWTLAAAAFVAIPLASSAWLRARSDSWVHAGIVWEIVERGIPPQDPRFAGLSLNYVWFYNLFVALCGALRPAPAPFTTMAVANVCWIGVLVWLGWQIAWCVWRERKAAGAALPLLLTGLNAGALALWPLWLLRALRGEVRGAAEVKRILAETHTDRVDVMHQLSAPYAWMVNAWDKFMVGTALGYAYVLLVVMLWAGARWLGDARATRPESAPPAWRWLVVASLAACGMMLFHSVVGLSAIPVGIGACMLLAILSARDPRWGSPGRALAFGIALLVGLAASWPYFRSISGGWDPSRSGVTHHYLHLDGKMPWTLLTACGVTALAAWPGARRVLAERNVAGGWLLAWTAGMLGFALVVHLPEGNESKFVWQVFAPLAILGGLGFPAMLASWQRRLGRVPGIALALFLFALPSLLLLRGFLLDRSGATASETRRVPGESALYAWVRVATPANAVFLDDRSRDVLLVEGRRRLLAGTPHAPERAAFPRDALIRRRAVMADLYGPTADLAGDARLLDSLSAPAFVLYRTADLAGAPWTALDADSTAFALVRDADGFRVYRRKSR
jgi:hypothetical protein